MRADCIVPLELLPDSIGKAPWVPARGLLVLHVRVVI